jgi:hypothetical protein
MVFVNVYSMIVPGNPCNKENLFHNKKHKIFVFFVYHQCAQDEKKNTEKEIFCFYFEIALEKK